MGRRRHKVNNSHEIIDWFRMAPKHADLTYIGLIIRADSLGLGLH